MEGSAPVSTLQGRPALRRVDLLTGIGLFAASVLLSIAGGFAAGLTPYDEAWFLQVVHRVTSGEVLYRDVFFGVTPLSVQMTAPAVRLFGAEILVIKTVVGLCFAFSALLVVRVDRQLGGRGFPVLLIVALLTLGRPEMAPYSGLSTVFLLATLSAVLHWQESASRVALAAAGLAAGLSFASKQNLGAYAAAALLASLATVHPGWRALGRRLVVAGGAFALAAGLPTVPIWLDGATERFLADGFLNKVTYLEHAGVGYLESSIQLVRLLPTLSLWDSLAVAYDLDRYLVPPLAAAALLAAWFRVDRQRRAPLTVVFVFAAAGVLGVLPRADTEHMIHAMPLLIVGLAYGLREAWPSRTAWKRVGIAALLAWFGFGLAQALMTPAVQVGRGAMRVSTLPHFRWALIPNATEEDFTARARMLAAAGEQPFLLIPEAGFYYLLTGLRNPTPYDYPYVTTFGPHGQRDVIASIEQGRIKTVCFAVRGPIVLRPDELARYVQEQMTRGEDAGACTVYHRRG